MGCTKLDQLTYLTEFDPEVKLEMSDIKTLSKTIALCTTVPLQFHNVVFEEFSDIFNCRFGPVCLASIRGVTLGLVQ